MREKEERATSIVNRGRPITWRKKQANAPISSSGRYKRFQPNPGVNFVLEWIEDFQQQGSSLPVLLRSLDSILYGKPTLSPELHAVVLETANNFKTTQNAVGADALQVPEEIIGRLKSVLAISRGY